MNSHDCIAHPCGNKTAKGSGFCTGHKKEHNASPWVKAWRKYQKQAALVGHEKAVWSPPRKA